MSGLKFNCGHCGQSLEAPEDMLGQEVDCPSCSRRIKVPAPGLRVTPQPVPAQVTVEVKRGANPLGIAALVMGILASLTCWIPFVGLISIPLALIGLLLGFIGLLMAAISKKTGFVFPVSGVLVCALSVFIALTSTGGCAKAVSDAAERADQVNQLPVTPSSNSVTPAQPDAPTPPVAVPDVPAPAPEPPPPKEEWIDASTPVRQGDIEVQLVGAKVGKVAVKTMFGDDRESKESALSIQLRVSNHSPAKKVDFVTWRESGMGFGDDDATLTDDNENRYKPVLYGSSSTPVGGVNQESVYPGKQITDVLVFEVPVDAAQWLRLKLSARNFGGTGTLRIQIPANMIQR